MPIYEFRCNNCHQKSTIFVKSITGPVRPACPACGSADVVRTISGFAFHKSEQSRLKEAGEPQRFPNPDYYKDPRNIGRWAEKRLKEMGMEMPQEAQEMVRRAREGELPPMLKDL